MSRPVASKAALLLFRALIERSGAGKDRIFLVASRSVDWQSLTFVGERHEMEIRVSGADAAAVGERICENLSEDEFTLPGLLLADIALSGRALTLRDGSVQLNIEALTLQSV